MAPRERIAVVKSPMDPIHHGHLALIGHGLQDPLTSLVCVYPSGGGRLPGVQRPVASAEHRIKMTQIALATRLPQDQSRIELNPSEAGLRTRPPYRSTLGDVRSRNPRKDLVVIAEPDTARGYWKELAGSDSLVDGSGKFRLHFHVSLQQDRHLEPDETREIKKEFEDFKNSLEGPAKEQLGSLELFRTTFPKDASPAQIRDAIAQGKRFEDWVHPDVAAYIKQNGLYRPRFPV